MAASGVPGPDDPEDDARWRSAGDRIQTLLDASATGGAAARQRAEELVAEVTDLYGEALARVVATAAAHDADMMERLAADDLVASLLLVHGLHPHPLDRRVADALDSVRPYLGSHGGDVELLDITDGGLDSGINGYTVRLRFAGSCKSCPSSSVTLELAVEDAIRAAAPEIDSIEVVPAESDTGSAVIPAESLLTRVHANGHSHACWYAVPDIAELAPGEVGGFLVGDIAVLACRVADQLYAYRDRCPNCTDSLAGARLRDTQLRCPHCDAGFDVVHAGAGIGSDSHLQPMPLLMRDGVLSMAVADEVAS
jgi:Fe-S cluster biogenesis protein NfuA/nitrite reductase/ring-hydroxylating ferredoxin subunit